MPSFALLFIPINLLSWGVLANTQLNQIVFTAPRPDNFDRLFPAYSGPGIHQFFVQCATYMHSETHKLLCQPLYGNVRIDFVLEPNIGSHQSFGITKRMNCKVTVDESTVHLGCAEANIVEGQSSIAVEILRNPIVPSSDSERKRKTDDLQVGKSKRYSADFHVSSSEVSSLSSIPSTNSLAIDGEQSEIVDGSKQPSVYSENAYLRNRTIPDFVAKILSNWENTKRILELDLTFGENFYFDDILMTHRLKNFMDYIEMPTYFDLTKLTPTSSRLNSKGYISEDRLFICQLTHIHTPTDMSVEAIYCFSKSIDKKIIISRFKFRSYPDWVLNGFSFWCKVRMANLQMRLVSTECLSFEVHPDGTKDYSTKDVANDWDIVNDPDFRELLADLATSS